MINKKELSKNEILCLLQISDYILNNKIKNGLIKVNDNGLFDVNQKIILENDNFKNMCLNSWNDEIISNKYTSIDLFAGCGGLSLGLEYAGFSPLLLNEIDKNACLTLKENRPNWNVVCDSIVNLTFKEYYNKIDLLTGGIPCQSFSYSGKRLGFNDIRGTMFFEYIRAVQEINPKVFLIENVKGLVNHDNGKTFKTIKNTINDIGYTIVEDSIFKAIFYKVPQKRERLFIIAVRNDLINNIIYKKPDMYHSILNVKDALKSGILYKNDVLESDGILYSKNKAKILDMVSQGGYWKDLPLELQKSYLGSAYNANGGSTGVARRLSWEQPSLTLTCSPAQKQTERCHPDFTRPLQIREYARIQTFPDTWIFKGTVSSIYKQIGNAVPVNLSFAIGKSINNILNQI